MYRQDALDAAKVLAFKTYDEAIEDAKREIVSERTGEQLGLFTSWDRINRGQGKYFRFNHVTQFAAPTGHGKSYVLNQITDDFLDFDDIYYPEGDPREGQLFRKALNGNFQYKESTAVIHFGFEMSASDEIIRSLSRKVARSYNYILSSEFNNTSKSYNVLEDDEFKYITGVLNYIKGRKVYYVEITGDVIQMFKTVQYIYSKMKAEGIAFPKLIINIDHTFLVQKLQGMNDSDLIQSVALLAIILRKTFGAMVNLAGQCNQNLKSFERMSEPNAHYPNDSDIYFGSQVNWACDNIWIFPYQPALIGIKKYGAEKVDTTNLVVASCTKSRKGRPGSVYLVNKLQYGIFEEMSDEEYKKRCLS
jgi:hypothetical protein